MGSRRASWRPPAEPVDGPTVGAFARLARRGRSYVVVPILTREAGAIHNSAILLDRDGNVAAVYRKRYPTLGELEWGVTPGTEAVVVNTDFGRVGLAICFDVNFRDVGEDHLAAGAELVLFPSMFPGGLFLPAWGHNFGHFMVSATPRDGSRFVDPLGREFVQTESTYEPVVSRRINLDFRVLRMTRNLPKQGAIKAKYGPGVEIDIARDEAEMCLYSHLADRTAGDILAEFGLETRADFFARYTRRRTAALREPATPETPNEPDLKAPETPEFAVRA